MTLMRQTESQRKSLLLRYSKELDPYFSLSRFKRFMKCSMCYGLIYRVKLVPVPNVYMLRGSIVHGAIECMSKEQKFDLSRMLEYSIVKERAKYLFTETASAISSKVWEQAYDMAQMILIQMTPEFKNVILAGQFTEEEVVVERIPPNGIKPYLVLAYIDMVIVHNGVAQIIDWKTDREPLPQEHLLQGSLYCALWEQLYGVRAKWNLGYLQNRQFQRGTTITPESTWGIADKMVENIRREQWSSDLSACDKPWSCEMKKFCPAKSVL